MKKKIIALTLGAAISGLSCFAFAGCGHQHNYESVYQPATCTDRGYTLHTCTDCGYQYADGFVEPYGHAYESCHSIAVPVDEAQAVSYSDSGVGDQTANINNFLFKIIPWHLCEVPAGRETFEQQRERLHNAWLRKVYGESNTKRNADGSIDINYYVRKECPFCGDGEIKSFTINVPNLATVPVPNNIDISKGKIVATMDVTPSADNMPAFGEGEHDHCFDLWTQLPSTVSANGANSGRTNPATVAGVSADFTFDEQSFEMSVDVTAGSGEVVLAANTQPAQIRQMTMADSIEEIEANAFGAFTDLRRVELPDKLKKIGAGAFGAAKLDFLIIPNGLKEIGANAFGDCNAMKCVFYFGTEAEWNGIAFGNENDPVKSVPRYYYSDGKPTAEGNFWHFVNGEPTLW